MFTVNYTKTITLSNGGAVTVEIRDVPAGWHGNSPMDVHIPLQMAEIVSMFESYSERVAACPKT